MENKNVHPLQQFNTDEVIKKTLVAKPLENIVDEKVTAEEELADTKNKPKMRLPARAARKDGYYRQWEM